MTIISRMQQTVTMYRESLQAEEKIMNSKDGKYKGKKGFKKRFVDFYNQRMFTDDMLDTLYSNIPM